MFGTVISRREKPIVFLVQVAFKWVQVTLLSAGCSEVNISIHSGIRLDPLFTKS